MKKRTAGILLCLSGVFAAPDAAAQFSTDKQLTSIGNQVQEILNRINAYTALTDQFVNFDCASLGMALGAVATPEIGASVPCDTLNMPGAFEDSYRSLMAAPANLLKTAAPTRGWRAVLAAADTVAETDIRAVYQTLPDGPDAALAAHERRRERADRQVVLAHAESDAAAALAATLDEAEAVVNDLEARNAVTETGAAQTQVVATLTRGRLLVALSQLRAYQAAIAAAEEYNAEVVRREAEARRVTRRAALQADWAATQAALVANRAARLESMYGGFKLHPLFGGSP